MVLNMTARTWVQKRFGLCSGSFGPVRCPDFFDRVHGPNFRSKLYFIFLLKRKIYEPRTRPKKSDRSDYLDRKIRTPDRTRKFWLQTWPRKSGPVQVIMVMSSLNFPCRTLLELNYQFDFTSVPLNLISVGLYNLNNAFIDLPTCHLESDVDSDARRKKLEIS